MDNAELTNRVIALDETVARQGEQIKTAFRQISDVRALADSVHDLAKSVAVLAEKQRDTAEKVDDLTEDMDEIKARPAKAWEKTAGVILSCVITALITFVLTRLGLQ